MGAVRHELLDVLLRDHVIQDDEQAPFVRRETVPAEQFGRVGVRRGALVQAGEEEGEDVLRAVRGAVRRRGPCEQDAVREQARAGVGGPDRERRPAQSAGPVTRTRAGAASVLAAVSSDSAAAAIFRSTARSSAARPRKGSMVGGRSTAVDLGRSGPAARRAGAVAEPEGVAPGVPAAPVVPVVPSSSTD
ncbi:hypothetical protein [Streptomyces flavofungini]|uniref:hypothetical protein n=1 Tax=Streptomyces flavofungini TaxID=68200 RepID=UPI00198BFFE5|nr:hypothetical protein [Streptomyces flavofungini]GHC75158.1 hypothetical protein GCM10010349_54160 [Streptomyces flavofungini]